MALLPETIVVGNTGHIANSNQVHSKLNETIDVVADFGADPTGTNDSYTAINNAIQATNTNGGIVFFPQGTYDVGTTLDVTTRPSVTLRGVMTSSHNDSKGSMLTTRTNGMTLLKVGSGSLIHQGPTLEGLHFRSKTGQTGFTFVDIFGTNRWRIDRCNFDAVDEDTGTGLYIHHTSTDNAWWQILQPLFRGLLTSIQIGAVGAGTGGSPGGTIIGGAILGGVSVASPSVGIACESGSNIRIYGLMFDNCGTMISGKFNECDFVGLKCELPGTGGALVLADASRRNKVQIAVTGNGSTTGPGLVLNSTANDNYYIVSCENMGSAVPVDDTAGGVRNIGIVMQGGYAETRVQHFGATTPLTSTMPNTGDIAVGNGKIWVNDAGTIKSVAIA